MRHTLIFIILSAAVITSACNGSNSVADDIAAAELALANEDVTTTRNLCNGILSREEKEGVEASQFARLSILYMQLNDRTDNPDDIELAARCFREAYKINPDSASAFYQSLPVDEDKYAMTLAAIVHTLDNPKEIPTDHDREVPLDEIGRIEDTVCDSIY